MTPYCEYTWLMHALQNTRCNTPTTRVNMNISLLFSPFFLTSPEELFVCTSDPV